MLMIENAMPSQGELEPINVDPVTIKHTVKDSVFHTLFVDKINVLEFSRDFIRRIPRQLLTMFTFAH